MKVIEFKQGILTMDPSNEVEVIVQSVGYDIYLKADINAIETSPYEPDTGYGPEYHLDIITQEVEVLDFEGQTLLVDITKDEKKFIANAIQERYQV